MFSYFGSKSKLVKLYPQPVYSLIIEPFAGSARYACHYRHNHKVWLNDLDPTIYGIWKWIQQASRKDIEDLPELRPGDNLKDFDLPDVVKDLLGFAVVRGATHPRHTACGWAAKSGEIGEMKTRLLSLFRRNYDEKPEYNKEGDITDWKITNQDYRTLPNKEATWFIDPPYQRMGDDYSYNNSAIDYLHLREWCLQRKGQIIVCEGTGANWLPFTKLTGSGRVKRKDSFEELIWTRGGEKHLGFFSDGGDL